MKVLVAGGTGFIGKHLIPALLDDQHEVIVLGRNAEKVHQMYGDCITPLAWENLNTVDPNQIDAVINLAGENISAGRWSDEMKHRIKQSRIDATQTLSAWCASAKKFPHLYNASAIGIYGSQVPASTLPSPFLEKDPIHEAHEFLNEVGRAWEKSTAAASAVGVPVTCMRFAPVLKRNEGMLQRLMPSFQWGLGGIVGSGMQAFSWVYIDDVIRAIRFLLKHKEIVGPVNIVAPGCVMQREFASALAKAMRRPALMHIPAFLLRLLFGQMAEELLLSGQHAYPQRLQEAGFHFLYPNLEAALEKDFRNAQ